MISHAELLRVIHYDPLSGEMRWRVSLGRAAAGNLVGTLDPRGYRMTVIHGEKYWLHRLAWFYVQGSWPMNEIDHINHCKGDNRIANLRDVSHSANLHNREIPALGIKRHHRSCTWSACIIVNKKRIGLGYHKDWFEAVCARKSWDARNGLRP